MRINVNFYFKIQKINSLPQNKLYTKEAKLIAVYSQSKTKIQLTNETLQRLLNPEKMLLQ